MQILMSHMRRGDGAIYSRSRRGRCRAPGPLVGALLAFGAVAAQESNAVTIDNFTFGPQELTVAVGTTVKWVNHDDIPHNVIDKNKAFRSKALDTDDAYSYTFASAGTFDYFCGLHPHMVGKIIVK